MTSDKKIIITRFAPSPTGDLHIGGLRTALYEYLFAKKHGGKFLLRIEDTDRQRYKKGSEQGIFNALEWAGLKYDNSPVYQSSRIKKYQKYAKKLVKQGHAYYCFCSADRLEKMRQKQIKNKQAPKYDRHCLKLSEQEIKQKLKQKIPYVIRMKIPEKMSPPARGGVSRTKVRDEGVGEIKFHDLIRGDVSFNLKEIDDQILIKSDGYPTYHLANIIDDHKMKITHVIRGEEWLPSTPKHILLYQAFDWQPPKFAHIPLTLAKDKSKLSKRHGAVSVMEFKKQGYLPEALLNYIALLGWNPGDDREIFSLQELISEFSLDKVHQAGAIFDRDKLDWMNAEYIKKLDLDKLVELCLPFLSGCHSERSEESREKIKKIIALEQQRIKKLSEITNNIDYFFQQPEYEKELLKWKKPARRNVKKNLGNESGTDLTDAKKMLEFIYTELEKIPANKWSLDNLQNVIIEKIKQNNYKNGNVLWPLRVALSGQQNSPSPFEIAEILNKTETLKRIKIAIEKI